MRQETNHWKGFVLGMLGGAAGLLAMHYYQRKIALALAQKGQQPGDEASESDARGLKHISLIGKHYQQDESSTAALGRLLYQGVAGKAPGDETKTTLSHLVHWGYGICQGGTYGAMRGGVGIPDLGGGLAFATGLWLLGDELTVPLLGLQGGSGAASPGQHINRFGLHLAYGLSTAATTQMLYSLTRILRL